MAIYSVQVKSVSRGGGRSATAAAAYRTASEVIDYRTGTIHDYSRRRGVDHVSMHLPAGVEPLTTEDLWNRAELAENRKNSQVARELLTALPHELDQFQRRTLAEQIAAALVERYGVAAQAAVHAPDTEGDNRNWHAHILFTTRRMDASGQLTEKTRELDVKPRSSAEVEWMREMVEVLTNQALEQAGRPERVDRRSLVDQRAAALAAGDLERAAELDRLPTIHEGPRVTQIRRECEREQRPPLGNVVRLEINNAARQINADRAELRGIEAEIIQLEQLRAARAQREAEARQEAERCAQEQQQREQLAAQERERIEALRRQIVEQAREENRAGDRMVRHARTVLERAQGDYQRAQEALAGLPQLHQERAQAIQKANGHQAEARRLNGEADAWLASHKVRALAGMTGPADELREKAARHAQAARDWAAQARRIQEQAEGREVGARIAGHSVEGAQRTLAEAEANADRRWRDQGGEYAAQRRAELAEQPEQGRQRASFLDALQRVQERTQGEREQDQDNRHDWDGPSL